MTVNNSKTGRLFVISAPSGAGKSTVIGHILKKRGNIVFSISATTRPPRDGELHGVSYHFITHDAFEKMIAQDEFLEHAKYAGNYYGTPKKPIFDNISQGFDVILDIDVQGAGQIIEKIPGAVTIFIAPPSIEELERRLRSRGTDSDEKIAIRLQTAKKELILQHKYSHIVVNDNAEHAAMEIISIMDENK